MIEVYCDESRPELIYGDNGNDQFMVIGGIWIPHFIRNEFKKEINKLKLKHNINGEFKWKNVSPSKLDFYKELIDLYLENPYVRFRCIVVDSYLVDVEKFHDSDSELGFYKFYYQLLVHWLDNPREQYWVYLDYKKNKLSDRLHILKTVLKRAAKVPIGDVQAIESKQSVLIQLADILIGAVGYCYNGYETSKAKLSIVDKIENYLGSRIRATNKNERKFNVFVIDLR